MKEFLKDPTKFAAVAAVAAPTAAAAPAAKAEEKKPVEEEEESGDDDMGIRTFRLNIRCSNCVSLEQNISSRQWPGWIEYWSFYF